MYRYTYVLYKLTVVHGQFRLGALQLDFGARCGQLSDASSGKVPCSRSTNRDRRQSLGQFTLCDETILLTPVGFA